MNKKTVKDIELEGKKVLSYFGFAVPVKGIESLFKCMPHLDDDTKLLFINNLDEKNEYHKSLLDLIKKLDISDKVVITGFLDSDKDVADLLQISNVCVLPFVNGLKKSNGSFLAAYNQKIKVITTRKKDEKDGNGIYYVEPNDEEQLLETIKRVLEDKKEYNRDVLTWDNVAKSHIDTFNEIMWVFKVNKGMR